MSRGKYLPCVMNGSLKDCKANLLSVIVVSSWLLILTNYLKSLKFSFQVFFLFIS